MLPFPLIASNWFYLRNIFEIYDVSPHFQILPRSL